MQRCFFGRIASNWNEKMKRERERERERVVCVHCTVMEIYNIYITARNHDCAGSIANSLGWKKKEFPFRFGRQD